MNKPMIKYFVISLLFVVFSPLGIYAQVGMISNSSDKSAALDMKDTNNKGVLLPNAKLNTTTDVTGIAGGVPAQSLLIYNTNASISGTGSAGTGFYYWDTNIWKKMITQADVIGDNLGDHTATKNLDMTNNNILNIQNGYVKNDLQISDRILTNTNYFGIYKNNGFFRIKSSSNGADRLVIDENTGNVGVGTINPKNRFSVAGGPISQDDFGDGDKYLLLGISGGPKITQTAWTFGSYSGSITDANNVPVSNQTGLFTWNTANNGAWSEKMRLAHDGTLSFTGNLKIGSLSLGAITESLLSVDSNGNVHVAPPIKASYTTASLAPGASQTITLTLITTNANILVSTNNICNDIAAASFVTYNNVIAFQGGQAKNIIYASTVISGEGNSLGLTASGVVGSCTDGGNGTQFNFDIVNTTTTITITNRGNVAKTYVIQQSVF